MQSYGVAVMVVHRGKIRQTHLVLGPLMDHPHMINVGDQEFAEELCRKMRKAWARSPIPDGDSIYNVVPLPMTTAIEVA
jgi:hypothetical protein